MQNALSKYAGVHGPVQLSGELRMTFRVQRYAVLSESRMREICMSGSMGGCGNGVMVKLLRHRQTKGAATARQNLRPPRHISTLPVKVFAILGNTQ